MLDLESWMRQNGHNDQSVADQLNLTRSYVHRIKRGEVNPSLTVGLSIHQFTRGEVSLEMLLPRALRPAMPKPQKAAKPAKPATAKRKKPATKKVSAALAAA